MPAQVLSDRYWLSRYRLMPQGGSGVGDLPLDDYYWFPLIDLAEAEAGKRRQASEQRGRKPRRGGL